MGSFGKYQYGTLKSEILPRLEAGKMVITEIELQESNSSIL